MGKDKLRKFRENETFGCLVQPSSDELLDRETGGGAVRDFRLKGRWARDFFGNDNPIVVELGCGKGDYTVGLALNNPDVNFIGIDIKGARLWKGAKYATGNNMRNVAFIRTRIEFIGALFGEGEISEIWITFADPQIGREKKRLTGPLFLGRYRNFLKKGGIVHLKTDSTYLYEYSKAIASQNGLQILACAPDLYGKDRDELAHGTLGSVCGEKSVQALFNVQTFYEKHFLAQGYAITYLAFLIDHEGDYLSPEWDEDLYRDENHQAFAIQVH
ncbi:MAG: tRNA (guanosine(46)-N7)-methyltransferase TrmB [Candidatus Cryptobacteroides sp.]